MLLRKHHTVYAKELIDTLWNVNVNGKEIIRSGTGELIDTLWNVNSISSPASPAPNKN